MITSTIIRDKSHMKHTTHCWDMHKFMVFAALAEVNGLLTCNYFNCLHYKDSCVWKSQFACIAAKSFVSNKDCDDEMDVDYNFPLTRCCYDLPHWAHFYKTERMPSVLIVTLEIVCYVWIFLKRESIGNHQFSQDWSDILLVFTSRIESLCQLLKRFIFCCWNWRF